MSFYSPHKIISRLLGKSSKELFSERFYEDLKNDYNYPHINRTICKDVYDYDRRISSRRICEKVLKYLENSPIWDDKNSEYDVCILLNYWIYDTLARIFGDDNAPLLGATFGKLHSLWNELIENENEPKFFKNCAPDMNIPLQVDWRKSKELYDYYVDFKTIFGTAAYYPDECRDYYKLIEDKTSLYDFFEKICTTGSNNCPKFYDKCKPYNPRIVLKGLPCHAQIQKERADEEALAMQKSLRGESGSTYDTGLIQQNSEIGTKVGHSVLGVAPVLLTASVLYRYTPIGSWIRRLGGNTTNSISDMGGGEMDGFLSHTQESGDMFFGDTQSYISYQPM
ncbi:PIR protein [Plasmodium ovale]|uniref:PIR Superfamily Protein n=2 Tax=Plasmodium ovale TaxID=36330 RepID=A0A1A8WCT1_PLAOA|nr:PIR Superfamily Protein [Plasmodium ovale curtisi]SBT02554.1 PIR Superfamily Protein [Plasmodium ovale curtisi]SBT83500.1 PIR protein [Plasmodium ovale]